MERRVQVLPASRVDLGGLFLPGDHEDGLADDLAYEEHLLVNLAFRRLLAVHQAQQADDGRGDL
eukprot:2267432-Pleurochrysis_carterae.AAC.1